MRVVIARHTHLGLGEAGADQFSNLFGGHDRRQHLFTATGGGY
jgi:hypothetical protein